MSGFSDIARFVCMTHLLQVHAFHCPVHAFDYGCHVARHLSHCDRSLHPARDCIDTASETE